MKFRYSSVPEIHIKACLKNSQYILHKLHRNIPTAQLSECMRIENSCSVFTGFGLQRATFLN